VGQTERDQAKMAKKNRKKTIQMEEAKVRTMEEANPPTPKPLPMEELEVTEVKTVTKEKVKKAERLKVTELEGKALERRVLEDTLGFSGRPSIYQLRDYLVTQTEPFLAFQRLKKVLEIDKLLERAIIVEMRRLGFNEFPLTK
jgi:hypothetical protein